jgi:hypothetical protein
MLDPDPRRDSRAYMTFIVIQCFVESKTPRTWDVVDEILGTCWFNMNREERNRTLSNFDPHALLEEWEEGKKVEQNGEPNPFSDADLLDAFLKILPKSGKPSYPVNVSFVANGVAEDDEGVSSGTKRSRKSSDDLLLGLEVRKKRVKSGGKGKEVEWSGGGSGHSPSHYTEEVDKAMNDPMMTCESQPFRQDVEMADGTMDRHVDSVAGKGVEESDDMTTGDGPGEKANASDTGDARTGGQVQDDVDPEKRDETGGEGSVDDASGQRCKGANEKERDAAGEGMGYEEGAATVEHPGDKANASGMVGAHTGEQAQESVDPQKCNRTGGGVGSEQDAIGESCEGAAEKCKEGCEDHPNGDRHPFPFEAVQNAITEFLDRRSTSNLLVEATDTSPQTFPDDVVSILNDILPDCDEIIKGIAAAVEPCQQMRAEEVVTLVKTAEEQWRRERHQTPVPPELNARLKFDALRETLYT